MADLKISQLPAAAPITGSELIELVQSGGNVQSTVGALPSNVSLPSIIAGVIPAIANSSLWTQNWQFLVFDATFGSVPTVANGNVTGTTAVAWQSNGGGLGTFSDNPTAASIWLAQARVRGVSAAAINSAQEFSTNAFATGAGGSGVSYRKVSASPLIAGFNLIWTGSFSATKSDQVMFVGWCPRPGGNPLGGSFVPSATLNMVGFGKDSGDTNIQFMVNNGAGTATKTDTGITMASIQAHMVRISVGCDPAGALITAVLQDLETGGVTKTYTVADGATKNIVANQIVTPHIHVNTRPSTTTTQVELGASSIYAQYSFIQ